MEMNFSKNFAALRKKNGYTQEKIAEILGLSRQAITKWESGESEPDMVRLLEIAQLFNKKVDDLLCANLYEDTNYFEETNKKLDVILEDMKKLTLQVGMRTDYDLEDNLDYELLSEYKALLEYPNEDEIEEIKEYLQAGFDPIKEYEKEGFETAWDAILNLIVIERGSAPEIFSHIYELASVLYEKEYDEKDSDNGYIEYISIIAEMLPTLSEILKNEIALEIENPGRFV